MTFHRGLISIRISNFVACLEGSIWREFILVTSTKTGTIETDIWNVFTFFICYKQKRFFRPTQGPVKQWCNWVGALGAIAPPSRKSLRLPFLKEHKNKIILFVLSHLNFCPAVEKYYYLPILLKMSKGAAKTTETDFRRCSSK